MACKIHDFMQSIILPLQTSGIKRSAGVNRKQQRAYRAEDGRTSPTVRWFRTSVEEGTHGPPSLGPAERTFPAFLAAWGVGDASHIGQPSQQSLQCVVFLSDFT